MQFALSDVPHQCKMQEMCEKAISENDETLKSVHGCYKNPKMYNRDDNNYAHGIVFALDCYKTQKICYKAVNTSPSAIQLLLNARRLKKCVLKLLILFLLYWILFLIDIKLW